MLASVSVLCLVICLLVIRAESNPQNATQPDFENAQVIVCAIMRHEQLYVDEWVQYHKFLGFDFLYLYDNNDQPSAYLAGLPEIYGDFVRVKHFPGMQQQAPAYRDCVETFRHNNTWAAIMDLDEFIVLRKHDSIKEFLLDVAPNGGSVVLNWSRMSNNGILTHEAGPVVARFTYTTHELKPNCKSISYLAHTSWVSIHNCGLLPGHPKVDVRGRAVPKGDVFWENVEHSKSVAYINHYHTKSLEEFFLKKRRGQADRVDRGVKFNDTLILALFDNFNLPLREVEDTFARDFYLRHHLGKSYERLAIAEYDSTK